MAGRVDQGGRGLGGEWRGQGREGGSGGEVIGVQQWWTLLQSVKVVSIHGRIETWIEPNITLRQTERQTERQGSKQRYRQTVSREKKTERDTLTD